MLTRLVTAALYRLGVVRQLQELWRQDQQAAEGRSASQAQKAVADRQALQQSLQTLDDSQKKHWAALKESHARIEQLTGQLAALTETCTRLERRAYGLEQVIIRNREDAGRLQALRRIIESGSLVRHVTEAIASAPLVQDPAPMMTIDRIFPDDVYETLIAAIPPAEAFTVKDRTKANYHAQHPQVAVPDLAQFVWPYLDDDLIPRTIVPAVAKRFAPFVAAYYRELFGPEIGAEVATLPLEPTESRLMLRTRGYHLDPHLDPKRVLLTTLLYFARPGDSEAHGTAFYRVDGAVVRDHATTYYPQQAGHRCEFVQTVPFRRNTAVVFLNTAAHGADIPATAPKDLERYAMQFYIGPPVDALQSIVRRLPEAQQRAWGALID